MHRDKHIVRAILKGNSNTTIARKYGVSQDCVRKIRREAGLPSARAMPATIDRYRRNPVLVERDKTIIRMYLGGAPVAQIMHELAVTRAVISSLITKTGIAQNRQRGPRPMVAARNQRIVARYQEGVPLPELATEFGISLHLVSNVLSTAGATHRRAPVWNEPGWKRVQSAWDRQAGALQLSLGRR